MADEPDQPTYKDLRELFEGRVREEREAVYNQVAPHLKNRFFRFSLNTVMAADLDDLSKRYDLPEQVVPILRDVMRIYCCIKAPKTDSRTSAPDQTGSLEGKIQNQDSSASCRSLLRPSLRAGLASPASQGSVEQKATGAGVSEEKRRGNGSADGKNGATATSELRFNEEKPYVVTLREHYLLVNDVLLVGTPATSIYLLKRMFEHAYSSTDVRTLAQKVGCTESLVIHYQMVVNGNAFEHTMGNDTLKPVDSERQYHVKISGDLEVVVRKDRVPCRVQLKNAQELQEILLIYALHKRGYGPTLLAHLFDASVVPSAVLIYMAYIDLNQWWWKRHTPRDFTLVKTKTSVTANGVVFRQGINNAYAVFYLYQQGLNLKEIHKETPVSEGQIQSYLKQANLLTQYESTAAKIAPSGGSPLVETEPLRARGGTRSDG